MHSLSKKKHQEVMSLIKELPLIFAFSPCEDTYTLRWTTPAHRSLINLTDFSSLSFLRVTFPPSYCINPHPFPKHILSCSIISHKHSNIFASVKANWTVSVKAWPARQGRGLFLSARHLWGCIWSPVSVWSPHARKISIKAQVLLCFSLEFELSVAFAFLRSGAFFLLKSYFITLVCWNLFSWEPLMRFILHSCLSVCSQSLAQHWDQIIFTWMVLFFSIRTAIVFAVLKLV